MGRHSTEGMQLRYCGLGECKAPCRRVACYDPSLYRGSGVFTISHIDPSPQDVGTTHRVRMRRGASPVALRRRSMQYPEYRVPGMHLLLTGSWVNKPFSDAPVFGRCHHVGRGASWPGTRTKGGASYVLRSRKQADRAEH